VKILYYTTPSGNSPVRKFIDGLSQSLREDFLLALDRLRQGEALDMPLSKPLFKMALGLHELRLKERRNIFRVFYFIKRGDAIYLVHAMQKKTETIPNKDRQLILRRLKEI
jgi:phage-related protein